jgi:hypothetical protein
MTLAKGASTTILSNKTAAAAGSTTLSECATIDTDATSNLAITVKLTYGSSGTLVPTVKVFASEDDSNWDTDAFEQFDMPTLLASNTKKATFALAHSPRYLKVQVTNNESAGADKDITAVYVYSHKQDVS